MRTVGQSRHRAGPPLVAKTTVVSVTRGLVWVVGARFAGDRRGRGRVGAPVGAVVTGGTGDTLGRVLVAHVRAIKNKMQRFINWWLRQFRIFCIKMLENREIVLIQATCERYFYNNNNNT